MRDFLIKPPETGSTCPNKYRMRSGPFKERGVLALIINTSLVLFVSYRLVFSFLETTTIRHGTGIFPNTL
jgi:hypothetical protein